VCLEREGCRRRGDVPRRHVHEKEKIWGAPLRGYNNAWGWRCQLGHQKECFGAKIDGGPQLVTFVWTEGKIEKGPGRWSPHLKRRLIARMAKPKKRGAPTKPPQPKNITDVPRKGRKGLVTSFGGGNKPAPRLSTNQLCPKYQHCIGSQRRRSNTEATTPGSRSLVCNRHTLGRDLTHNNLEEIYVSWVDYK